MKNVTTGSPLAQVENLDGSAIASPAPEASAPKSGIEWRPGIIYLLFHFPRSNRERVVGFDLPTERDFLAAAIGHALRNECSIIGECDKAGTLLESAKRSAEASVAVQSLPEFGSHGDCLTCGQMPDNHGMMRHAFRPAPTTGGL